MMQSITDMLQGLFRVMFLRGSPERIHYTRRRFIIGLLLAIVASTLVQIFYFNDHLVFIVLRVFAEMTMFMLAMVILTTNITRFRLAYLMLILVMISVAADSILLLLGLVMQLFTDHPAGRDWLAIGLGAIALYGASNVMAWGLRKKFVMGAMVMLGYVAAVLALNVSFRYLYEIVAAG